MSHQVRATTRGSLLDRVWADLHGDPLLPGLVGVTGDTGLDSVLDVDGLALAAVGAQLLAAAELTARGRPVARVALDAPHIGVSFRSERFLRVDGRPAGGGFAPLSRFHRAVDGWVRLHANYPWHRRAALAALGADPAAAIAELNALEVENAVVAAGGVAAAVRTPAQWATSPQGRSLAGRPFIDLHRVGAAPPRRRTLTGLRVLDLTRVIAGPVATRTLASHGAKVLRVDSPRLPEDPVTLLETGPGKRNTRLDLDAAPDRRRFAELLTAADVLVHGYRPGALQARGLDADTLTDRYPGLAVVSLSAWGTHGPWAIRRGFDSVVQAATGIAHLTRDTDETPRVLPAQALDHGAGHLLAATVMRALNLTNTHGGTWHGELSLAGLAQHLLTAPSSRHALSIAQPDPDRYLVDLPSPGGTLTVVRPPGSPTWPTGPETVDPTSVAW